MSKSKSAAKAEESSQPTEAGSVPAPVEERQPGDEPAEQKREFQPVRGWTSRFTGPVQYRRFSDANLKIIAFKFNVPDNEKPPEEVLAVMHANKEDKQGNATGLKFQTTRSHGKIWTLPNDVEGRTLADRIDYQLSQVAKKLEASQGQTPF